MSWAPNYKGGETDANRLLRRVHDGYACGQCFEDETNIAANIYVSLPQTAAGRFPTRFGR